MHRWMSPPVTRRAGGRHSHTATGRATKISVAATAGPALEPHADALGCSAALAHVARITHEGSDASFLRRQHLERGSSEGMVEAAIAAFRGEAAWG